MLFKEYFKLYKKDEYVELPKIMKIFKKNPSLLKINEEIIHYVPKIIS